VQLINERTRKSVADAVEMAETRASRRRGLLGRAGLDTGAALMLIPCFAVHTAFMRFAIDVIFLDGDGCVVRTVSRLAPWRMAICIRARAVIELPAGHLEALSVNVGDALYLVPTWEQRRAS
jgi:uncharacterized membrane protein (UPF0127 family)